MSTSRYLRSRNGEVIHRDTCARAGKAVRWNWANNLTDREVIAELLTIPWMRTCKTCFLGTKEELWAEIAAGAS